jgi:hypothetical protein
MNDTTNPETLFLVNDFNVIRSSFNSNRSGKNSLYRGMPLQTVCIGHFGLNSSGK